MYGMALTTTDVALVPVLLDLKIKLLMNWSLLGLLQVGVL